MTVSQASMAQLIDAARAARERAYAPYSKFAVGAALLDERGRVHAGCNIENAAYPHGQCAEASALAHLVLAGGTRVLAAVVVGVAEAPVTPCGGCRQKLREFADDDTPVWCADLQAVRGRYTLGELLPASFGPMHLPTLSPQEMTSDARIALACLDLTSLNDNDDAAAIDALCAKAQGPAGRPAALCVWPRFVAQARAALPASIRVAAVANFPDGALDAGRALRETQTILDAGGDEVDLVLPWRALAAGDAAGPAALVAAVRAACAGKTLKLIIESGELRSPELIRQAGSIGLDAGVDFLKTSTGKTGTGATPEAARLILETIAGHARRGAVGFKASGGVRTVADAAVYIALVRELLGESALTPMRLRFGASSLLADIEAVLLRKGSAGKPAAPGEY